MTIPSQRALILYRPRRFINHLLTYLLPYVFCHKKIEGRNNNSVVRTGHI